MMLHLVGTPIHVPVIALTAYSLRGDKERFMREGFDGYVSKPMDVVQLIDEMKRVLEVYIGNTYSNRYYWSLLVLLAA